MEEQHIMCSGASDKTTLLQVSFGPVATEHQQMMRANADYAAKRGYKYVVCGDNDDCSLKLTDLAAMHEAARRMLKKLETTLACLASDVYRFAAAELLAPVLYVDRDCLIHDTYTHGQRLAFAQTGRMIDHFMFYAPDCAAPKHLLRMLPIYWGHRPGYGATHAAVMAEFMGQCDVIGKQHFTHTWASGYC